MSAERIYPEAEPKIFERTVYMGIEARLHVTEMSAEEAESHYPSKYRATAQDFPGVVGHGVTQEGALVECERALKRRVREKATEGATGG